MNALVLGVYLLDLAIGDPEPLPHPVRAMGAAIVAGERLARRAFAPTPRGELVGGTVLTVAIVAATAATTAWLAGATRALGAGPALAYTLIVGASALATRNLLGEAQSVRAALRANDLPRARERVGRIVGRDTADSRCVRRRARDHRNARREHLRRHRGPALFFACGGAPAALAFKAVSTLDSMIGHREAPYRYFGTFAARLDDVANLLPARLTALALALAARSAGGSSRAAIAAVRCDARKHASPNAGFPEAAIAGALGVRLGGPSRYDGVAVDVPFLNAAGRAPSGSDVDRAIALCGVASLIGAAAFAAVTRRA